MSARRYTKARNIQRREREAKVRGGWLYEVTGALPDGRTLHAGEEFSVRGQGRFRFIQKVTNPQGDVWIDAFGGKGKTNTPSERREFRSFPPERVATIHRIGKLSPRKGQK